MELTLDKEVLLNKDYDNPNIKVVWEDYAENFTQDKLKNVKHYFQKKYNTTNVNVITKVKKGEDIQQEVDLSVNIMDQNYQHELIKNYLKQKNSEEYFEDILTIDGIVNNEMIANDNEVQSFKKWYIKNIEFSNFLSFGDNQKVDYDNYNGITIVEGSPPNFVGKSVLSCDLLLFLFFNETTKTSKAEEIFNRFREDKNKVSVKGEIIIDGEEYILLRTLERKRSKSGDWNVKGELDFYKRLSDGELQNFTGEQRRETEKFIKSSIGTKEDFLMTILTTASNLEELIDSKPTARGQVLSRFLGMDFLKQKEEVAKKVYNDFSRSMLSNVYSSDKLLSENDEHRNTIQTLNDDNVNQVKLLQDTLDRITKGQEFRDELLKGKHNDIDQDIVNISPENVQNEILKLTKQLEDTQTLLNDLNVVEPSEYYYEDKHDDIKDQYKKVFTELNEVEFNIKNLEELKSSVNGGIKCEHCGIELMNAKITQEKLNNLDGFNRQKLELTELMTELTNKEQGFVKLKKEFDEYEKNKLIKEKHELTIESINLKIKTNNDLLNKYNQVQDKILSNNKIEDKLLKANARLGELEIEKNGINRKIDYNNNQVNTLIEKIKSNVEMIDKILVESEKETKYKMYLEIFGKNGISKMMMKTMMPVINSELQRLLENTCHFKLEVRINDKNEVDFIMVDNNTQVEKNMISGSGYERTVASLALRSVLSKISSLPKPNIMVMDEVFGKISNENMDLVYDFFVKIQDYFEKIFVITHNPLVSNWGTNNLRITKQENISYIVK
jgi:DNA repair exonuclease SbcCD ATPase subunit